ncbi:MAG: UDP-N-acetylglucosamine 2-epimerase, partial [Candidatus Hydrothermia bacterium]
VAYREAGIEKPYILATLHRAENVDQADVLKSILEGMREASEIMPVVFPIHPRTLKRVEEYGLQGYLSQPGNIRTIPPVGYLRNLSLLLNCQIVMTDSGGLQKEALFARKPCITIRDRTEWPETLEGGANRLAPCGCGLAEAIKFIIENPPMVPEPMAFGCGLAGRLIVEAISET